MFSPSTARLRCAAIIVLVAVMAAACQSSDTADPVTQVSEIDEAGQPTGAEPTADEAADAGPSDAGSAEGVPAAQAPTANLTDGCADPQLADAAVDWFPDQVAFDVASGISVTYEGNAKIITIDQPTDAPDPQPFTLALVQCGTSAEGVTADAVVEVPIDSAATYSTTFLQGFELIDRLDVLSAHGGLQYVSSEAVITAADAGDIVEVGDQTAPDLEVLAAAEPDVILVSAGFGGADATEAFAALDIPVVPNASWMETDPLGRAEWMKLEAMLLNQEAVVTDVFDDIAADYRELLDLAQSVEQRPTVLTNAPFEGTWFVSGGESYTASVIEAAGGDYVFADLEGSTAPLDLEAVLADAQDADVWLSAGSVLAAPEDFLANDERLSQFQAYPDAVWAEDADLGPNGGNRYYEDGAVRPDLVLADVIAILHPELLPDHQPRFYGLLGSQAGGGQPGDGG